MRLHRAAGDGRYAQFEREQRWRLPAVPPGLVEPVDILDRYVIGTRLRLRRMSAGDEVVYKFVQKVRPRTDLPTEVKLTNLYLSEAEYAVLAELPARELSKTRRRLRDALGEFDDEIVVDEFHGELTGLVLAEVELTADEPMRPPPPALAGAVDVSADDRFTGGALAGTTRAQLADLVRRDS